MKRCLVPIFWMALCAAWVGSVVAQSDPPNGYYDAAIGKTGAALKSALHDIIKGHTQLLYTSSSTDTWDALRDIDKNPANPAQVVLVYSGFLATAADQYNGQTGSWDREHLWPQSYGLVVFSDGSRAKTDIFNLRPIEVKTNEIRLNKYYDTTTPPGSSYAQAPQSSYDGDSWEPRLEDKGLIARSLFYMAVRYDGTDSDVPDLELSDTPNSSQYKFGKLTTVLAWNRLVPVTASERARNHRIYTTYQHNRNPFIDHPEFADLVFVAGATPGQAWKSLHFTTAELANNTISGDTADPDNDGLKTVVEYAFHRDPRVPERTPLVTPKANADGSVQLVFTHNRWATDATLSYETSSDLLTWTPVAGQVIGTTVTNYETEQLTVRLPGTGPKLFARIRVTKP